MNYMRWRILALISLGINMALAAAFILTARQLSRSRSNAELAASGVTMTNQGGPNIVLRRQFFSWRAVESDDYPTYISNLREIGCPEQTIRDIIIADVNALYSRRRGLEVVTPEQQWWRAEPDSNVVQVANEKARLLGEERHTLLARLLGTSWEGGDLATLPRPSRPGIVLDGPVLGVLSTEAKQAVEEINLHSQDHLQSYLDSVKREGKTPDPVELAKIRQQTRNELQRVLSPPQLEEFLLRYSESATTLRAEMGQLKYFNPTPDEFRVLFRSVDQFNEQIQLLAAATDPNSAAQRKNLEEQRENSIKSALGPKRYEEYKLLQDPLYRDAVAKAQQAGTPDSVMLMYQINLASASEQNRIQGDSNLTEDQKAIELKKLELEQLQANTVASGQELPPDPTTAGGLQPTAKKTYTVRPGDSASVVSMIYGIPVNALKAANPNKDMNRLRPGDSLNIPPVILPPAPPP